MDPFQKYKTATLSTDDSVKKLLFVFDEVIKLLYSAQKALGEKDYESKHKNLSKAIEVFYILKSGIDDKSEGDALRMMNNFYISAIHNLEQANLNAESAEDLDSVVSAIVIVRDSIKAELEKATVE